MAINAPRNRGEILALLHRIIKLGRRLGARRCREHAERTQLLLREHLHLLAVEPAAELLGDALRNLVIAAPSVRVLRDEIEQLRHLHHLAVGATRDVRRILETRALVLADQLDPVGQPRRFAVTRRSGSLGLEDLCLLRLRCRRRCDRSSPCD